MNMVGRHKDTPVRDYERRYHFLMMRCIATVLADRPELGPAIGNGREVRLDIIAKGHHLFRGYSSHYLL